jgi:hypothetical protein
MFYYDTCKTGANFGGAGLESERPINLTLLWFSSVTQANAGIVPRLSLNNIFPNLLQLCIICCSHSGDYEEHYLRGYNSV